MSCQCWFLEKGPAAACSTLRRPPFSSPATVVHQLCHQARLFHKDEWDDWAFTVFFAMEGKVENIIPYHHNAIVPLCKGQHSIAILSQDMTLIIEVTAIFSLAHPLTMASYMTS